MSDSMYKSGDQIGERYIVQEMIGSGTFSCVYKIKDYDTKREYALKTFLRDDQELDLSQKEFDILRELGHNNIARVFDIIRLPEPDSSTYHYGIKLEYIDGRTLSKLIGNISPEDAYRVVTDLLRAIHYLHGEKKVMYRDMKPDNVIVTESRAVIVDFNVSKLVETQEKSHTVIGTRPYMPPEVFLERTWNWTGDLYSIGIILYQLLTGKYPFGDPDNGEKCSLEERREPFLPRRFNKNLSDSLIAVLLKSIAYEPKKRYQSAEDMFLALKSADWSFPLPELPPFDRTAPPFRLHFWQKTPVIATFIIALLASMAGASYLFVRELITPKIQEVHIYDRSGASVPLVEGICFVEPGESVDFDVEMKAFSPENLEIEPVASKGTIEGDNQYTAPNDPGALDTMTIRALDKDSGEMLDLEEITIQVIDNR